MQLQKIEFEFDGQPLNTIIYRGKPCWVVGEVGAAIGYADKSLVKRIHTDWQDEFVSGKDFVKIEGVELVDFKALFKQEPDFGTPFKQVNSLILLFEPGLYLVLTKTNKPAGKALRRKIVDEILPQISRDGKYMPDREVDPQSRMSDNDDFEAKKKRLLADLELLKIAEEKAKKVLAITKIKREIKDTNNPRPFTQNSRSHNEHEIHPDSRHDYYADPTRPIWEDKTTWLTPRQIGAKFNIDPSVVGKAISYLGFRGDIPGTAFSYTSRPNKDGETFTCFKYSPQAVEKIRRKLFGLPLTTY